MPSYTAPVPVWVGQLAPGANTSVNSDGFSGWAGMAGLRQSPASGGYELEWGYKYSMVLVGPCATVLSLANAGYYNRGLIHGGYIINNSSITPGPGGKRTVTIHWQSIDSYLPPDEFGVEEENVSINIERHPIFAALQPLDFATVRAAYLAATISGIATGQNQVQNTTNPALATKLLYKMWNGYEVYYGPATARYVWSTYYLPSSAPTLQQGGYIQIPGGPSGYVLPPNFVWLRLADKLAQAQYSPLGGILKLTRNWVGGANVGAGCGFDPDIYPSS